MKRTNINDMKDIAFFKKIVAFSLVILAAGGVGIFLLMGQFGLVQGVVAAGKAKHGNYQRAMEIVESITDEDIRQSSAYKVAGHMYTNGDYVEAQALFEQLDDYSDSVDRARQSSYSAALQLYQQGDCEAAYERLVLLDDYMDAPQQLQKVRYDLARQLSQNGDYSKAIVHYIALGEYGDSSTLAYDAALALTGDEATARTILESGGIFPEELEMSLKIMEFRSLFPEGALQAGANHTVLLHADGTVSACGDNSFGQCNVSDWRDIVSISVGTNHTVGLKSDGTVVAAGSNSYDQCSVGSWSGITAIAACESDTYGITTDGTVVSTGYHDYGDIRKAANVTRIYAGSYAAVAQTSSGAFITSHKTYSFTAERDILSVALDTGFYAALQMNGKCVSSLEQVMTWENIACVDAGPKALIAADVNGRVHSHFFRATEAIDFSSLSDVNQCAAGLDHYVFLHSDGTVTALGDNTYGQCDIALLGTVGGEESQPAQN